MKISVKAKHDAGERRYAEPKGDIESVHRGSLAELTIKDKQSAEAPFQISLPAVGC
jgi:hypothetical protein